MADNNDDIIEGLEDNNLNFMEEEDDGFIDDLHTEEGEQGDQGAGDGNPPADRKPEEKEDDVNFDDEEEEEEDDDDELDIEKINKALGTDFKTAEEFKKSVHKEEQEDTIKKEQSEYNSFIQQKNNYDAYLKKTNEDLVRTRMTLDEKNKGKDINSPAVIEEIQEKIDALKDLGELDSSGEAIRFQLQKAKEDAEKKAGAIEATWNQRKEKEAETNRANLTKAFTKILSQDNFYGVKITPEIAKEVYKEVKSGKFAEEVNKNQELIAEFALIRRFKEVIQKNASGPTRSDGIKEVFDQFGNNNRRDLSQARNGTGGRDASVNDSISGFVK